MSKSSRITLFVGTLVCLLGCAAVTRADEAVEKGAGTDQVDAAAIKQQALAWIDDYRTKQVLFNDEDIAHLRKELAEESPEKVMAWWTRTAPARAALETPQWRETREWLREFLRVQAIYSDEQIDEFRAEAKQAVSEESPRDFKEMLADIERKRANLIQGSADNRALRESQMSVIRSFRQEQAAGRIADARAAARTTPPSPTPPPTKPREQRFARPPLVDSLDVARWNVMRNFWGW